MNQALLCGVRGHFKTVLVHLSLVPGLYVNYVPGTLLLFHGPGSPILCPGQFKMFLVHLSHVLFHAAAL
jgi:hypothetical protein